MYRNYNPTKRSANHAGSRNSGSATKSKEPTNTTSTAVTATANKSAETCPLCCYNVPSADREAIFAIGPCNHPICYHCFTKMRKLQEINECAICRNTITEVIYGRNPQARFNEYDKTRLVRDGDIYFESTDMRSLIERLLVEKCLICSQDFKDYEGLKYHLPKKHNKVTCDICAAHLKIFPSERKYYSVSQLKSHMAQGDEKSPFRGHPICKFDNERFMDEDHLREHIRLRHYTCFVCPNSDELFKSVIHLQKNFKDRHYLCEEGECRNNPSDSVFSNSIDLKAHRARFHCAHKSEARNTRNISLDLNFNSGRPSATIRSGNPLAISAEDDEDDVVEGAVGGVGITPQIRQSLPRMDDFPALGAPSSSAAFELNLMYGRTGTRLSSVDNAPTNSAPEARKERSRARPLFSHRVGLHTIATSNDNEFPSLCPGASPLPTMPVANGFLQATKKEAEAAPPKLGAQASAGQASTAQILGANVGSLSFGSEDFPALPVKMSRKKAKQQAAAASNSTSKGVSGFSNKSIINTAAKANASATALPRNDISGMVSLAGVATLLERRPAPVEPPPIQEPPPPLRKPEKARHNSEEKSESQERSPPRPQRRQPPPGFENITLSGLASKMVSMDLGDEVAGCSGASRNDNAEKSKRNDTRSDKIDSRNGNGSNRGRRREKQSRPQRNGCGGDVEDSNYDNGGKANGSGRSKRSRDNRHDNNNSNIENGLENYAEGANGVDERVPADDDMDFRFSFRGDKFIEPDGYKKLCSEFQDQLEFILGKNYYDYVRCMSKFKDGEISADVLYMQLIKLFNYKDLKSLLPEMIALIPDIRKQNELYAAYKRSRQIREDRNEPSRTGVWKMNDPIIDLNCCPSCQQMLLRQYARLHLEKHKK